MSESKQEPFPWLASLWVIVVALTIWTADQQGQIESLEKQVHQLQEANK